MKKYISLLYLLALTLTSKAQQADTTIIKNLINKQQIAWNTADLEAFMQPYWHSDSLLFIGKNGVKYGWHTTLNNYKKSYPTAEIMGKLQFTLLSMQQLGADAIFVVGKWALARPNNDVNGHFTLLWKKIKGQWVIVADHSS